MRDRLSVFQIIKISANIYRKNFKNITISVMFVFIPFYIIIGFIPDSLIPSDIDFFNSVNANALMRYIYLIMALTILFEPLVIGAISTITFKWLNTEQKATIPEILDNSLMKWFKLSLSALIFSVIIVTTATLIFPAVYFAVTLGFYCIITAVSDKWGLHAFIESSKLVKRRWWYTALRLLIFAAMAYICELAINSIVFVIEYPFTIPIFIDVAVKLLVSYFYVVNAVFCHNMITTKELQNEFQI